MTALRVANFYHYIMAHFQRWFCHLTFSYFRFKCLENHVPDHGKHPQASRNLSPSFSLIIGERRQGFQLPRPHLPGGFPIANQIAVFVPSRDLIARTLRGQRKGLHLPTALLWAGLPTSKQCLRFSGFLPEQTPSSIPLLRH